LGWRGRRGGHVELRLPVAAPVHDLAGLGMVAGLGPVDLEMEGAMIEAKILMAGDFNNLDGDGLKDLREVKGGLVIQFNSLEAFRRAVAGEPLTMRWIWDRQGHLALDFEEAAT